jgi:hypothetical protein
MLMRKYPIIITAVFLNFDVNKYISGAVEA